MYGPGVCKEIFGHDGPTILEITKWRVTWEDKNLAHFGTNDTARHVRKFARNNDINALFYQIISNNCVAFYYEEDMILYKLLGY